MNNERLINATKLDRKLEELMVRYQALGQDKVVEDYNFVRTVLDSAPTVEAAPVVHGRWVDRTRTVYGLEDYRFDCSVCGSTCWSDVAKSFCYCPECGAQMDLE